MSKITKIDQKSGIPLHKQAESMLRKLISKEEYREGKLLPSETDLSEQMNISRNTLRQAINTLVFEGLLIRKKGYGTKVVPKGIVGGVQNWLSFSQEMKQLGITICNFELRVSRQVADDKVRAFMKMPEEDTTRCVVLERVRGKKEYPFVYFVSYFNPAIPLTGEENYTTPLYEMLEQSYGVVVKTSREEITARLAGEHVAAKLEISPEDPILVRKRFVYDTNGMPVEYNIGYYRADSFTYTIEAER